MKLFVHDKYYDVLDKTTVVFPVGGSSKRIQHIARGKHKSLIKLPNNKTMLDIKIGFYAKLGFRKFVLLASQENYEYFIHHLNDKKDKKYEIKISVPDYKTGRGGAVLYAYSKRHISKKDYLIIHNPDDIIVDKLGQKMIQTSFSRHLNNEEEGAVATMVCVEGVKYPYATFSQLNNIVTGVYQNAFVNMPVHIGVTFFAPLAYKYFKKYFADGNKEDFESKLFSALAKEQKLYSTFLPKDVWLPVNDQKAWDEFVNRLEKRKN